MRIERDNMNTINLFIKKQEISCWLLSYQAYCYNDYNTILMNCTHKPDLFL
jgi:galactose-1-phosphate uridylyltransferase